MDVDEQRKLMNKGIIQRTEYKLQGLLDVIIFLSHLWRLHSAVSHIHFHWQCFNISFILCHVNSIIFRWVPHILQCHSVINVLICVLSICMDI